MCRRQLQLKGWSYGVELRAILNRPTKYDSHSQSKMSHNKTPSTRQWIKGFASFYSKTTSVDGGQGCENPNPCYPDGRSIIVCTLPTSCIFNWFAYRWYVYDLPVLKDAQLVIEDRWRRPGGTNRYVDILCTLIRRSVALNPITTCTCIIHILWYLHFKTKLAKRVEKDAHLLE